MARSLKARIAERAEALGFDAMRITTADGPDAMGAALDAFLGVGSNSYSGDMFLAPDGLIYFRFSTTASYF